MRLWAVIVAMALVTYATRWLPLVAVDQDRLPAGLRRDLQLVPIAVLSAIAGGAFVPSDAWLRFTLDGRLVAGLAAVVAARLTGSVLATLATGLAVLLLAV